MATTVSGLAEGVFDNTLMFISSANLTVPDSLHPTSGIKIRGTTNKGLGVRIYFPSAPNGTKTQILPEIHVSADNSTYRLQAQYPGGDLSWASGTKEVYFPFQVEGGYPYVKLKFNMTNTTTGSNSYGAVQAGIVQNVDGEWSRTVRFD